MAGAFSTRHLMATWHHLFTQVHVIQLNMKDMRELLAVVMDNSFIILSPILFSIMLGGVVANLVQTGCVRFSMHPLLTRFH
jgi:flagellar biosynthesis protein FlhB